MDDKRQKLTLDRPATYQIKVPGHLDESWAKWDNRLAITVEIDEEGQPITTLTGTVDQAALHGLLRRLYAIGLPLVSVNCISLHVKTGDEPASPQ